ncbi:MAG: hypothetical protein GC146_11195 [Limimaricola sp.]|uniref:hypothetical protein n=1 Tax=Limimaricola sp. TaxID=2211665 RepID=UPI001D7B3599|nr:hypothetical protein [Limimaricola sp.]MBI1417778.1 hypothetical protein [Limimaricola sp.]
MKHVLASLFALLPSLAHADWPALDWRMTIQGDKPNCIACGPAEQAQFDADKPKYAAVREWTTREIREISDWMGSFGFPAPVLSADGPRLYVQNPSTYLSADKTFWPKTAGFYSKGPIFLNYEYFFNAATTAAVPFASDVLIENTDTLAHELFHGVQQATGFYASPEDWYREGMPAAVGIGWTGHKYTPYVFWAGNYTEPLHTPSDPYSRGEFFYFLGKDLGARDGIDYLVPLLAANPADGAHGLIWFDNGLAARGTRLSEAYPQFIANHATGPQNFGLPAGVGEIAPRPRVMAGDLSAADRRERNVAEVAADYSDVSPEFVGDWAMVEDKDRFYATVISIPEADRIEDLRLIVGTRVLPGKARFLAPMRAEPGRMRQPFNVRVSNVADAPATTAPQTYVLRAETAKIALVLPACVEPGKTLPIEVESPLDKADIDEILTFADLRASAGSIGPGPSFTAPSAAQTVKVRVTAPGLDGVGRTLEMGEIEVSANCMVQMKMRDVVATYTARDDFTEFSIPSEGVKMYLKPNDVAVREGGRWVPFPPGAKAMFLPKMSAMATGAMGGTLLDPVAGTGLEEFSMARMPPIYAERFSWGNLRHGLFDDGPPTRTRSPCADGTPGCAATAFVAQGVPVNVLFDKALRPTVLTFPEVTVTFAYGAFPIGRPPGW